MTDFGGALEPGSAAGGLRRAEQAASSPFDDALFASVMDSIRDSVLVTEAEPVSAPGPRVVYANRAFVEHSGYALEEILGATPRLLQGPDTDRDELDRVRQALEAWQPVTAELLNYRKDGTPFWVELAIAPVADATGWFTHWVSVQRDVTQRREREESERRRRAFLQSVLASLPAQTAILGPSGEILAVNAAWEDFWCGNGGAGGGCAGNYLDVCDDAAAAGDSDAERTASGIRRVIAGEAALFELDYECSSPTQERWFHLMATALLGGEDGQADGSVIVTHQDITRRKLLERDLRHAAVTDPLTRLPNRLGLMEALEDLLQSPSAAGEPTGIVVLALDLDGFQTINDSLGHERGDEVLWVVGDRLLTVVGDQGVAGRYGGDEFLVAVRARPHEAVRWAQLVADAVRAPIPSGGHAMSITTTIGIDTAVATPDELAEAIALATMRRASTALHRAKERGAASTAFFSSEMGEHAEQELRLLSALRRACEADELRLAYQPIVAMQDASVVHREALIRWEHQGQLLQPDAFLPLAERSGLMGEIGLWVLQRACRDAAGWLRRGDQVSVAVNLAADPLTPALPALVLHAAEQAGLPLSHLILEVTETKVLTDIAAAAVILQRLRDLGVRVHVDDFGTGYSSLAYLARLPIDGVKLDRMFVQGLPTEDLSIVRAVSLLAAGLGLEVVAEGVETAEQAAMLRDLGYGLGQGWLYGRPELLGSG
ncbi:MAG: putative bifunctional diguanylate cyclase/phosphodiesterase [Actinomycetes bacterium]